MPSLLRKFALAALPLAMATVAPQPAAAQFLWSPPDLSTPPVTGAEPEVGVNLPGATPDELRAGLLWNLRAAMNVAALQCDFEPTLLTTSNYNAMIAHHDDELAAAFKTVSDYFQRTAGKGKPGQTALDMYGTRIYSGFSTVQAQRTFCQTAGSIGRDAIFAPRGQLFVVAQKRMGELRKSLVLGGEQFYGNPGYGYTTILPSFDEKKCWKKNKLTVGCKEAWEAAAKARNASGG